MSLGGTVPKHLNAGRIPAQGMQNTSQKNSANVTFTSAKCPLEAQFRNTRTPAGFEPKACKTQARKTLRTSPLESIKNNNGIAREIPLQLAKPLANVPWRHSSETLERQQDSSPKACKTQARKTLRTLPLPVANVPWRHSSETLEHQQDSSPRHARHKPEKLSERYLSNP